MWAVQGIASTELLSLLYYDFKCSFLLSNSNGHGCMHKAAQRGKQDVAEWLVQHVSGILDLQHWKKDGEGYRPSGLAKVEGHLKLASWLKTIEDELIVDELKN